MGTEGNQMRNQVLLFKEPIEPFAVGLAMAYFESVYKTEFKPYLLQFRSIRANFSSLWMYEDVLMGTKAPEDIVKDEKYKYVVESMICYANYISYLHDTEGHESTINSLNKAITHDLRRGYVVKDGDDVLGDVFDAILSVLDRWYKEGTIKMKIPGIGGIPAKKGSQEN